MRQLTTRLAGLALLPGLLLLGGCVTDRLATASFTSTQPAQDVASRPAERYEGPRARVVVTRFSLNSRETPEVVGEGIADTLTVALTGTERYQVIEPSMVEDLVATQGAPRSERVAYARTPAAAREAGADLLLIGSVTEFEPGVAGTSLDMAQGYRLADFLSQGSLGLTRAHIALNLRLVDAATSTVVAATTVEGTATNLDGLDVRDRFLGVGLSTYADTPMEKAMRVAIDRAVEFLIERTPASYYRHLV